MKITAGFAYGLALTGYFVLLALLLIWPILISPPLRLPISLILIITVVPLLFPLRGLLHGRRSSYTWAGYLSLFYFIHAVTEIGAATQAGDRLAVRVELAASTLLFFGVVLYLKKTKLL